MPDRKIQVFLSIEKGNRGPVQYEDENTDVIVTLENGDKYVASFFTYRNIETLCHQHIRNGEFLNGRYFWVNNMVLIDYCSKENILKVVGHLIDEGDFRTAFRKL